MLWSYVHIVERLDSLLEFFFFWAVDEVGGCFFCSFSSFFFFVYPNGSFLYTSRYSSATYGRYCFWFSIYFVFYP